MLRCILVLLIAVSVCFGQAFATVVPTALDIDKAIRASVDSMESPLSTGGTPGKVEVIDFTDIDKARQKIRDDNGFKQQFMGVMQTIGAAFRDDQKRKAELLLQQEALRQEAHARKQEQERFNAAQQQTQAQAAQLQQQQDMQMFNTLMQLNTAVQGMGAASGAARIPAAAAPAARPSGVYQPGFKMPEIPVAKVIK